MKIQVAPSKSDYEEFYKEAVSRVYSQGKLKSNLFILNIIYFMFLGIAVAGFINFYEACDECDLNHLNTAVVTLVIWFVFTLLVQRWERKEFIVKSVSDCGAFLQQKEFEITESGIVEQSAD
jgi:hypothetical protein